MQSLAVRPRSPQFVDHYEDRDAHFQDERRLLLPNTRNLSSQSTRHSRPFNLIAPAVLSASVFLLLVVGYIVPFAAQRYAHEAVVLQISSLSAKSITERGVNARVQADVFVDANLVSNGLIRRIGRLGTWIAREVAIDPTTVHIRLPEYGHVEVATVTVPFLIINVRNGQSTPMDFVSDTVLTSIDGLRPLIRDYFEGLLSSIAVEGLAEVGLTSGIFKLGSFRLSKQFMFQSDGLMLSPNIESLQLRDSPRNDGLLAEARGGLWNPYPLEASIPAISFDMLVPGCDSRLVRIGSGISTPIAVAANRTLHVAANANIAPLSSQITEICKSTNRAPMDDLLGSYIQGNLMKVYVKGTRQINGSSTWLQELLHSTFIPIPFSGKKPGKLVESLNVTEVQLYLPKPDNDMETMEVAPRISARVAAIISTPSEVGFRINVNGLLAKVHVQYMDKAFASFDSVHWASARSYQNGNIHNMKIETNLSNVPVSIDDGEVFVDVLKHLLLHNTSVVSLGILGSTQIKLSSGLGNITIRDVPANGSIELKALPIDNAIKIATNSVTVKATTRTSISLGVNMTIFNPTPYAAHIPYLDVSLLSKNSLLGNASIYNTSIIAGNNTFITHAVWNPLGLGGPSSANLSHQLLNDIISARNAFVTIRPHELSLPSQPYLSKLLSHINVTLPAPKFTGPGDEHGEPHFLQSATMHLLSSTAEFVLHNPLLLSTVMIRRVNATATYNGSEVARINHHDTFAIKPGSEGDTLSPRLPVTWNLGSVGYEALKKALGGELAVDAVADCEISIGKFITNVTYDGKGIGARVRL